MADIEASLPFNNQEDEDEDVQQTPREGSPSGHAEHEVIATLDISPDANESEGRARMQHLCVDCLVDQNEALVAVGRASLDRVQKEVIPAWLDRMIQDRRPAQHFKHLQLHDEQRKQQMAGRLEAILWFQRKAPGEAWACSIRACHTESNASNHTHLLGVRSPDGGNSLTRIKDKEWQRRRCAAWGRATFCDSLLAGKSGSDHARFKLLCFSVCPHDVVASHQHSSTGHRDSEA
jgi:hypothetical protein